MIFIYAVYLYLAAGFVIAIWFSFFKVGRTDSAAEGTSLWFRLIIMPATILLWPIVLRKISAKKIHK